MAFGVCGRLLPFLLSFFYHFVMPPVTPIVIRCVFRRGTVHVGSNEDMLVGGLFGAPDRFLLRSVISVIDLGPFSAPPTVFRHARSALFVDWWRMSFLSWCWWCNSCSSPVASPKSFPFVDRSIFGGFVSWQVGEGVTGASGRIKISTIHQMATACHFFFWDF